MSKWLALFKNLLDNDNEFYNAVGVPIMRNNVLYGTPNNPFYKIRYNGTDRIKAYQIFYTETDYELIATENFSKSIYYFDYDIIENQSGFNVYNNSTIKGKRRFRDYANSINSIIGVPLNFNINGIDYDIFGFNELGYNLTFAKNNYDNNEVVITKAQNGETTLKEEFSNSIVDFGEEPQNIPTILYEWLMENTTEVYNQNGFDIYLYRNSAEDNRLDKNDYLEYAGRLFGVIREQTSITDMAISIELKRVPDFNYVYIPIFNRYYYVTDIVSINTFIWEISLSVDVLMSYKNTIKNLEAFIDRNEFDYNPKIIDKKRVVENGVNVVEYNVRNRIFTENVFGSYVISGIGLYVKREGGS